MINEHRDGRRERTRELFCLLSLGLWHDTFAAGHAIDVAANRMPTPIVW
jgi:hypothetical protein